MQVDLLIFWDWIACESITVFVMFFHAIILPDHRFFFEVPRIEEVQDPDSSPRREEVGRRTLGDYGGFLLSFFYHDRFQECTTRKRQARKMCPNKTPIASGVEESNSPRRAPLLLLSDSSIRGTSKKNHMQVIITPWKIMRIK